ncbi:MAG: protein translocase subunit SecF [Nocardioides sp.]|nr:protein translocase subunit SecF [Nocardioides sp.]
MGKYSRLGNDLYRGRRSIDFVHRRAIWYGVSLFLVGLAIVAIGVKGLNFGVEFTGGAQYRVSLPTTEVTQDNADELRAAVADTGIEAAAVPTVTTSGDNTILIQVESLTQDESTAVIATIMDTVPATADDVSPEEIGASWGREVGQRALIGVAVFLLLVVLFIWAYFREWKMSVAALVALLHDVLITIGVYALSGFPVTPSAVTGLLAILGFSMYDTVVVFDKVRENTHELRKSGQSYSQATNLAVNQTLVRSINTSIVALIPIGAILYVSAVQLGNSSLKDLALAQFVGMAAGVYSSVFIAPRVLVQLKSREKDVLQSERRAASRARHEADRYATVPSFRDDMPVREQDAEDGDALGPDGDSRPAPAPPRSAEALGKGRVVPQARGPVQPSGSSGRVQPTRQPRSKRGKG